MIVKEFYDLKINHVYMTVSGHAVMIVKLHEDLAWGIFGRYVNGPKKDVVRAWNSSDYPFRTTFRVDNNMNSLTNELLSPWKYPEYYL